MAPKAPSSTPPVVIPEGCPMHNNNANNSSTANSTGNRASTRRDPNKPIRVIKSTGLPVEARPKPSNNNKNVVLSQQILKQQRYEATMRWIRLLLFVMVLMVFMNILVQINHWLYQVDMKKFASEKK